MTGRNSAATVPPLLNSDHKRGSFERRMTIVLAPAKPQAPRR